MAPTMQILNVQETELERDDSIFMAMHSVTEIEEKAFVIEQKDTVNKVLNPLTRLNLYLFMNRDVISVKR